MKRLLVLLFLPLFTKAQNWSENIAPLMYEKCTSCHHSGGIAPSDFVHYTDVVADAPSIRVKVQQRLMPPWLPDPSYSRFAHERTLTTQQINDIVGWIQNGTPLGDTLLAPPPPVYDGSALLTNPDLILQIPTYSVNTSVDEYRCFAIPSGLSAQRFITRMEITPGDLRAVHHVLIFADTSSVPLQLDAQDPAPGYVNFGGTGSNSSQLIGVWAPGGGVYEFPAGMGLKLPPNANIVLQIHYPGGISGVMDSTAIRFNLSSGNLREVFISSPLNHFQLDQGALIIPANTTPTFTAHYTLPLNVTALSIAPHMHLLGRSITSYAVTSSQDTIPFIHIPQWDFHWQSMYRFPRLLKLLAGTTLYSSATYDNTLNNPNNPNDPPRRVTLGESTTDEMMLVYFIYTYYLPGDEYIVQDSSVVMLGEEQVMGSTVVTPQLYEVSPNPSAGGLEGDYFLPRASRATLFLTDVRGSRVTIASEGQQSAGFHHFQFGGEGLPTGLYWLTLETDLGFKQKKWIKVE